MGVAGRLVVLLVVLALLVAGCYPLVQPAPSAPGVSNFDSVTLSNNLVVPGTANVTGLSTLYGGAKVGNVFTLQPAVAVTVTHGGTFTPTWAYQQVRSAGSAGVGLAPAGCKTAGQVTVIENISNTSITFTDTTNILLSGNAVLGQYDTLTLIGDGTNCVELAQADN